MEVNNYPSWLVSVGQAKRLKNIGFDMPCQFFLPIKQYDDFDTKELGFDFQKENYNKSQDYWSIPSFEQVLEWFRKKGYESMIDFYCVIELIVKTGYKYRIFSMKNLKLIENDFFIEKYEEVREALINKLIEVYEEDIDDKLSWKKMLVIN